MLLRTGMSVKQAIVYNVVSSVLCFVGMAIGVALGNVSDATVWIFACVGGLFIYIALVDMVSGLFHLFVFICLSVCLYVYVCLSVCLSVCLYLSVYLSVSLSLSLFIIIIIYLKKIKKTYLFIYLI